MLNESYVNLEAVLAHLKGHSFLTIFPKIFNICKIEWKLIEVLLMKALAQMGGVNYHFLTGFLGDSMQIPFWFAQTLIERIIRENMKIKILAK